MGGQKVYDGFKKAADQIKPALKKQCEDDAKAKHNPHSHNPHSHNPHKHNPHSHNPHSHNPHSHNPHSHNPHKHNPHSHTKTSYSNYRGGNGGGAVNSYCSGKTYINYWKIRSGSKVDQIQGRCSDGSWLKKCGGNGGGQWKGSAKSSQYISVRSGSLIDKFMGKGGNGGGAGKIQCGSGKKITGYQAK